MSKGPEARPPECGEEKEGKGSKKQVPHRRSQKNATGFGMTAAGEEKRGLIPQAPLTGDLGGPFRSRTSADAASGELTLRSGKTRAGRCRTEVSGLRGHLSPETFSANEFRRSGLKTRRVPADRSLLHSGRACFCFGGAAP